MAAPLAVQVRAVLDRMDADVARTLADLGVPDYRPAFSAVVRAVAADGPLPIRDLAARLGVTHSAASQRVAEMVRRGLVQLAPGADARQRRVTLTDAALALRPALDAEWAATERAFAALNAELTATLEQVVAEMNAALDRRSFRDRIADAAGEAEMDDALRAAIVRGR